MATFSEYVQASADATQHEQEIKQTRIGGLGGSDAAMVYRIACKGISALTMTDTKRLCVMLGIAEQEDWGGNAHTNAGHAFEDYAEQHLPFGGLKYERERLMEAKFAHNFRTFAHADFAMGEKRDIIVECKFVQKPTVKVIQEYMCQLQWYYMLGASQVTLYHATGSAEPFEVHEAEVVQIERDVDTIDLLLYGIQLLDQALTDGWRPQMPDKAMLIDAPQIVQVAFADMEAIKAEEVALKQRKDTAIGILKEYIEGFGFSGIVSDGETKRQVIYNRPTSGKTFDVAKFLQEHPEWNDAAEYWKPTSRAASITFK